jgi:hypothetical protein
VPVAFRSVGLLPSKARSPAADQRRRPLQTVADAVAYITALPPHLVCRKHWQRACELILARADVAEVSRQPELALFYDAKLTQIA